MPTNTEVITGIISRVNNAKTSEELDDIINETGNKKVLALLRINKRHEYNDLMWVFIKRRGELLPKEQRVVNMTISERAKYLTSTDLTKPERDFAAAAQTAVTKTKQPPSVDKLKSQSDEELRDKLKQSESQALEAKPEQAIRSELEHRLASAIVKKGMQETDTYTDIQALLKHIQTLKSAAKQVSISATPKLAAALELLVLHAELNLVAMSKNVYKAEDRAAHLTQIVSALSREFRHAQDNFGDETLQEMSLGADVFVSKFMQYLNPEHGFATEFDKLNLIAFIIGPDFHDLKLKPLPPAILAAFTRAYISIASNKALPQIMQRQNELAKNLTEENFDKLYTQAEILLKVGDYIEDKAQLKQFYTLVLTPLYKNIAEVLFTNLSFKYFMLENEKLFDEIDDYLKQISKEQGSGQKDSNSPLLVDVYIKTLEHILELSNSRADTNIKTRSDEDVPRLTAVPDMIKALQVIKDKNQAQTRRSSQRTLKL